MTHAQMNNQTQKCNTYRYFFYYHEQNPNSRTPKAYTNNIPIYLEQPTTNHQTHIYAKVVYKTLKNKNKNKKNMSANSSGQPRLAGNFPALEKGPSLDPEAMEFSSDEATQTSPQSPHPAQRSRLSADQGMRRGARAPPGFVLFGIHGNRKKKEQKKKQFGYPAPWSCTMPLMSVRLFGRKVVGKTALLGHFVTQGHANRHTVHTSTHPKSTTFSPCSVINITFWRRLFTENL